MRPVTNTATLCGSACRPRMLTISLVEILALPVARSSMCSMYQSILRDPTSDAENRGIGCRLMAAENYSTPYSSRQSNASDLAGMPAQLAAEISPRPNGDWGVSYICMYYAVCAI
ncbi:hypothetical protein GGI43DRAFT_397664 [Trichoderma evansii]